jgi:hypothetical protein
MAFGSTPAWVTKRPRKPAPSRQSGGTSGELTVMGYQPRTPVVSRPYSPSEPASPVQQQIRSELDFLAPLKTAITRAFTHGIEPDYLSLRKAYGKKGAALAEKAFISHIAGEENLGTPEDLTNAITAATGIGGLAKLGVEQLGKFGAETALKEAGATAAEAGAKDAAGGIKGLLAQAAKKAEPEAAQAGRQAVKEAANQLPQGVKTAARVAAKGASYPVRHPVQAPFALAAPQGILSGNPLGALSSAAEGKGLYAKLLGSVGGLPGEALSLPASVVPSAYLGGKAVVNAAEGHPGEAKALLKQWEQTGLLPALAQGNLNEALKRFGERPIYSGLEASGALNAAGRVAGAGLRGVPGKDWAATSERPGLPVRGSRVVVDRGNYSRDDLRRLLQKVNERTSHGQEVKAGSHRAAHYEKEATNRFTAGAQRAHKKQVGDDVQTLNNALGRRGPKLSLGGHTIGKIDRATGEVLHTIVQRLVADPSTFHSDLRTYKDQLDAIAESKHLDPETSHETPTLNPGQLKLNRKMAKNIEAALDIKNPHRVEHAVQAANKFIELQHGANKELFDLGMLDPHQAEMASLYPYAQFHMGAGYGEPHALLKDLEAVHGGVRRDFRAEARAHLAPPGEDGKPGGYVGAHETAKTRLKTAESGYIQAERSLSTARATGRPEADVDRLAATRDVTKDRVKKARAEVRDTKAALEKEELALKKELKERTRPVDAEIKQHRENGARLLDEHGYPLSSEDVVAHMKRRGVEPPGFISSRPPSPGDYYKPAVGGAKMPTGKLTGASVQGGTYVGGIEGLVRQITRTRGLIHRANTWNEAISRFGSVVKGVDTFGDASKVIDHPERYGFPPGTKLKAVPRYPFGSRKHEIEAAMDHQHPEVADDLVDKAFHSELQGTIDGGANADTQIAFMPEKQAEQFLADAKPLGGALKTAQAATTLFKRAVLPFSSGFYIGNAFDNWMRVALAGVNPLHFVVGQHAMKAMSDRRREELNTKAHFASIEGMAPHRSIEGITSSYGKAFQTLRDAAEWTHGHGLAPSAVKFLPSVIAGVSHYMIATNALLTEDLASRSVIGKMALAEMHATQGSWVKALLNWRDVGKDFAKRAEDPAKMVKFGKQLEEVMGNYANMSPAARRILTTATPFWTWMRSAYKFAYLTMPAHHSIQTALITAAARGTAATREAYGLDPEGDKPLPSWLQGGIPLPDGGEIPWANYNSFGYAAQSPTESGAKVVLPQTPLGVLLGVDWKGEPIPESDKVGEALFQIFGGFVPGWNLAVHKNPEGGVYVKFKPSLPTEKDSEYLQKERQPWEQISIPVGGSSPSSSTGGPVDYGKVATGASGSSVDYGKVATGGG